MNIRSFQKPVMTAAVLFAIGGGIGTAHAAAYAVSSDDLSNLTVSIAGANTLTSATFRLDAQANLGSVPGSTANSTVAVAGTAPFNVNQALEGAAVAENTFTPVGNIGGNYARSDAQLPSTEINPGTNPGPTGNQTQARNIAESFLINSDTGFGDAGNSSLTSLTLNVASGAVFSFSFDATPFMQATVDAGSIFPSNASADIAVTFVVTGPGGVFFSWAPGAAPTVGDAGGSLNPFSLNQTISRTESTSGTVTFNPGTGVFSASSIATVVGGDYSIELRMRETVNTSLTTAIPEIDAVAGTGALTLLGGMLALAGERRRRRA